MHIRSKGSEGLLPLNQELLRDLRRERRSQFQHTKGFEHLRSNMETGDCSNPDQVSPNGHSVQFTPERDPTIIEEGHVPEDATQTQRVPNMQAPHQEFVKDPNGDQQFGGRYRPQPHAPNHGHLNGGFQEMNQGNYQFPPQFQGIGMRDLLNQFQAHLLNQ